MSEKRSTVLLDLDGTLTDPAPGIVACLQHAIRTLSGPTWTDAELRTFIGPPLHASFAHILHSDSRPLIHDAVRLYRERFASIGLYENRVYEGVTDALRALRKRQLRLLVATSKPACYAERIVEHFGLGSFVSEVYGSELSGERSVKSALLAHILRKEKLTPSEVCMVGDRRHDIEGARANGVAALGVLWGYGSRAELELAGAWALVEHVRELPSAVSALSM